MIEPLSALEEKLVKVGTLLTDAESAVLSTTMGDANKLCRREVERNVLRNKYHDLYAEYVDERLKS